MEKVAVYEGSGRRRDGERERERERDSRSGGEPPRRYSYIISQADITKPRRFTAFIILTGLTTFSIFFFFLDWE
jgi:hypothetical protein